MTNKPIWTYDISSPNDDIGTLRIRKLLQKTSQPTLETLHRFDLHAEQTLLYLYKHNEKYKERTDKRVVHYAQQILTSMLEDAELTTDELSTLEIEPHLIHEPTTELE